MDKINKEREDIYLFIAGDGDMQDEIDLRKNSHIIPVGRIDFEQIITLLSESDIFCLPSFSEEMCIRDSDWCPALRQFEFYRCYPIL